MLPSGFSLFFMIAIMKLDPTAKPPTICPPCSSYTYFGKAAATEVHNALNTVVREGRNWSLFKDCTEVFFLFINRIPS